MVSSASSATGFFKIMKDVRSEIPSGVEQKLTKPTEMKNSVIYDNDSQSYVKDVFCSSLHEKASYMIIFNKYSFESDSVRILATIYI